MTEKIETLYYNLVLEINQKYQSDPKQAKAIADDVNQFLITIGYILILDGTTNTYRFQQINLAKKNLLLQI